MLSPAGLEGWKGEHHDEVPADMLIFHVFTGVLHCPVILIGWHHVLLISGCQRLTGLAAEGASMLR